MQVDVCDDCDNCGGSLVLTTNRYQDGPVGQWVAVVGDTARCTDCGAVHHVHLSDEDSGEGYLQWDEL